nr:hypothetical protein CFP56_43457 [Quercus suber]
MSFYKTIPMVFCHGGRPKIKRKRHPSEPKNPYKLSKAGTIIKCSECKKGTVSTNAKKTPTTNKKQAVGSATASDVDSRAGGSRIVVASVVDLRAGGSRAIAASSTGANSERVVVPTLEQAIQRMQAKKKKKPRI